MRCGGSYRFIRPRLLPRGGNLPTLPREYRGREIKSGEGRAGADFWREGESILFCAADRGRDHKTGGEKNEGFGEIERGGFGVEALEGGGMGLAGVAEGFHSRGQGDGLYGGEEGGEAEHPEEERGRSRTAGDAEQGGGDEGEGGEDKLIFFKGEKQDGGGLDAQGVVDGEEADYEQEDGAKASEPESPGETDEWRSD